MLAGHYASALGIKALAPRAPLWALFAGVQLVDIAWAIFVCTGVEEARIEPGFTASNGLVLTQVVWSHSLLAALAWSGGAAVVARLASRRTDVAAAIGAAVGSHWLLDLPMHVPDLPLAGQESLKLGLGLWNHRVASFALEAALLAGAGLLYARHSRPRSGAGWAAPALAIVLGVLAVAAYFGPQPGTILPTALSGLFVYLTLPALAAVVDRQRSP